MTSAIWPHSRKRMHGLQPHTAPRRFFTHMGAIFCMIGTLMLAACGTLGVSTVTGTSSTACSGSHAAQGPSGSGDLGSPSTSGSSTGTVSGSQAIHLNITLAINQSALDACVQSINDTTSANFQHFLSPQDIADHFAPATSDINKLTTYLANAGLKVDQSFKTNAALSVDGTVSQVEQAFNVTLNQYQKGNRTVYAPDKAATLPADLQKIVDSITGLSTESAVHCNVSGGNGKTDCGFLSHYSRFQLPANLPKQKTSHLDGDCTLASIGTPGLSGTLSINPLLTWAEVKNNYGLNTLATQGFDGSGTSIGMVEFDTYDPGDVNNYIKCATGSFAQDRIQNVVVVPGGAAPDSGAGAGEATLDLELAAGMTSNKTHIINYYAPNDAQWESSLQDILHRAASDKKVSVLSISYGDFEEDMSPTYMASVNDSMKLLAAEGISVFVASGDCAAYGSGQYGQKALSFPASAPWAISVGGTELKTDVLGARQDEVAWVNSKPDPKAACGNTWGSGGGLSSVASFTVPAWQKGTGVSNQYSNGLRQVPDVSAAAINISFYYSGFWLGVGGTSAAAPIWAAGVDVVNQALAAKGKPAFGGVPTVYTLANGSSGSKAFFDVTKGSNIVYPATKGWDFVTGWGTPQFDQITTALGG